MDGEHIRGRIVVRAITYLPWLLKEIAIANWDVIKIVLSSDMKISPTLFHVKASQKSSVGQAIYGNSITLTPGTITVDVHEGEFIVHALTKDGADGVKTGEMDARVTSLEKEIS